MYKELLFEIGHEEIPASYMGPALSQIKEMAQRFLTGAGFSFSKILTYGTPRRMVLVVENLEPVQKANELKMILPKIIAGISFPKSMRWHNYDIRFARPIRWICSLYDGKTIHFDFEGVKPDKYSYGHRFLAPDKFEVKNFEQYQKELQKRFVIIDHKERKNLIKQEINETANEFNSRILQDDQLLEIVNWLAEYPVVLLGTFKKEFLELPRECLITAMRSHQRYFSLTDDRGNLLPYFITISNTKVDDPKVVIKGNEKVLTARLADAQFLFNNDKKIKLAKRVESLKKITFQEKLGTMYDKTQRLVKLSEFIADFVDKKTKNTAARAALLCKTDLATEMVGEFPDLQGVMGKYYAELSDEKLIVAQAIGEHYLPRHAGDKLPKTKEGVIVSTADRIDNLIGYFGLGLMPSATEDPYALRRQALGILQIIWETEIKISLEKLIDKAISTYGLFRNPKKIKKQLLDFLKGRFEHFLESKKYPISMIEAVLRLGFDDLVLAKKRLEALNEIKGKKEFEQFKSALKRVMNILGAKIAKKSVNATLLKEQAEKDLYKIVSETQKIFSKKIKEENYKDALMVLMHLSIFINKFFDKVLVMAKERRVRDNRLVLLSVIYRMAQEIADFRKLM